MNVSLRLLLRRSLTLPEKFSTLFPLRKHPALKQSQPLKSQLLPKIPTPLKLFDLFGKYLIPTKKLLFPPTTPTPYPPPPPHPPPEKC